MNIFFWPCDAQLMNKQCRQIDDIKSTINTQLSDFKRKHHLLFVHASSSSLETAWDSFIVQDISDKPLRSFATYLCARPLAFTATEKE